MPTSLASPTQLDLLCKVARNDGLEELAGFCERAEVTEQTHLARVRSWLEAAYRA